MTDNSISLGRQVGSLSRVALRSAVGTFVVVLFVGFVLAYVSFSQTNRFSTGYALVAGGLAVIEAAAAGIFLAGRRAALSAAAQGLESQRLGRPFVQMIFDRIAGSAGSLNPGQTPGRTAGLKQLPLTQVEELLERARENLLRDPSAGVGWQRKIYGRLVNLIATQALSRFRKQNAEYCGIDVRSVRSDLEHTRDESWASRLRKARLAPTLVVLIGLPLLVLGQTIPIARQAVTSMLGDLRNADRFELLSIEPKDYGEGPGRFHHFKIVGSTTIDEDGVRRKLVRALHTALSTGGQGSKCYYPRHAIRATHGDQTTELGICFECGWMYIRPGADDEERFEIGDTQPTFDEVLRQAGVPLAKPTEHFDPFEPRHSAGGGELSIGIADEPGTILSEQEHAEASP